MGSNDDRWCILTIRAARTLELARSLAAAGYEAWSPIGWMERRLRRKNDIRIEVEVMIAPTYVFVNLGSVEARQPSILADLWRAAVSPMSPHPQFAIFQWYGKVPLVGAAALLKLREDENRHQAASDLRRKAEEDRLAKIEQAARRRAALNEMRERNALARKEVQAMRAMAPKLVPGDEVTVDRPEMLGLVGTVEHTIGHETVVLFGGRMKITAETWLLHPARVEHARAA